LAEMLRRSASDVTNSGMKQKMTKSALSKTGNEELQLLMVGGSVQDVADVRVLLAEANDGQIRLRHAGSPEEVRDQLAGGNFDLLLCSNKSTDHTAHELLREVRQHVSGVALIFLSDPVNKPGLEATIHAAANRGAAQKHRSGSGAKVADSVEAHSAKRQHVERHNQEPDDALPQLWRSVEQMADALIIMDRSGVMEYVNPAFETLTGYSREEAIGQPFAILRSEQHSDELYEEMWNTVRAGNVFRGIVTNRKKDGEALIIEKALTPLRDGAGEITHFISTGRDITQQRKLESDLQQAQKMDAIGRLAGGVAHDFNNLLLVISAYAELMLDSLGETDPLRRNVAEIIGASRRAADLTRQLLAFGRKQMQSLQILDLNAVIGEITGMLPRLIGEDIELEFVRGQDLGKVKADPMQIEQVLMNLAANARDAMPSGGRLTIETSTVRVEESYVQRHAIVPSGDYVLLTVTDSGQGIAPEHLAHIFEPFYTTKEAGKGTGLGLATVYGIVKQNGGFVWVYSELGLGTTFKVYLPQVQPLTTQVPIAKLAERSPRGSETLLLVEDEISVRLASSQFLTRNGYSVLEAGNGEEALRLSRAHAGTIELMITDVVMPKMGGPALAEWLADERPNMKVLFVSGYAENTVLRHGRVDVASRFLQKPFSGKMLARKVREILEESETRSLETISRGLRKAD
jgi:two-component system cell cycle sensor histidine kinase/response regulator CckA